MRTENYRCKYEKGILNIIKWLQKYHQIDGVDNKRILLYTFDNILS